MTAPGLQRLEEELRHLKSVERPSIIRAIAEARSHGDLSENAEYHAARERQSFIEGRVIELEEIVSAAEVIDPPEPPGLRPGDGRRARPAGGLGTLKGSHLPDRRRARGGHQAGAAQHLLALGQGADRQEDRRHRVRAGARRGPHVRNPGSSVHLSNVSC